MSLLTDRLNHFSLVRNSFAPSLPFKLEPFLDTQGPGRTFDAFCDVIEQETGFCVRVRM